MLKSELDLFVYFRPRFTYSSSIIIKVRPLGLKRYICLGIKFPV